jgi:hypothetical protein
LRQHLRYYWRITVEFGSNQSQLFYRKIRNRGKPILVFAKGKGQLVLHPATKTLRSEGIPSILNPPDKHALEALGTKESLGGRVSVVSMAPLTTANSLREAIAMETWTV